MQMQHKLLIAGGVVGALLGVAAAFLYYKAHEEQIAAVEAGEEESMPKVSPGVALGVGLSVIGLLRQIVTIGD
jgi:hypothetical protein